MIVQLYFTINDLEQSNVFIFDVVGNMRKLTSTSFNKEDVNLRANSIQPRKDDVDQDA
jgi:hypothetical protein